MEELKINILYEGWERLKDYTQDISDKSKLKVR